MSDVFWPTDEQIAKLKPFFLTSHGELLGDDKRVLSGIILINRNGLRWRDAPAAYGPHKTLYSRWRRWSEKGILTRMMAGLAAGHGEQKTVMIPSRAEDATYLKAHRTATSMAAKKGGHGRLIGRTKGGIDTKLRTICDSHGRPLDLFVAAGQVSDYIGSRVLLSSIPKVDWLLGDSGYDADWFREALTDRGIRACIPGRKQRKTPVKYEKSRYKRRNRIEIMFGRFKDWRIVVTRYERRPKVFLSAIALTATVFFWL